METCGKYGEEVCECARCVYSRTKVKRRLVGSLVWVTGRFYVLADKLADRAAGLQPLRPCTDDPPAPMGEVVIGLCKTQFTRVDCSPSGGDPRSDEGEVIRFDPRAY